MDNDIRLFLKQDNQNQKARRKILNVCLYSLNRILDMSISQIQAESRLQMIHDEAERSNAKIAQILAEREV
ncbi:MAG: hypothetical protein ACOC2E_00070 [Bacteroidota bacterium]